VTPAPLALLTVTVPQVSLAVFGLSCVVSVSSSQPVEAGGGGAIGGRSWWARGGLSIRALAPSDGNDSDDEDQEFQSSGHRRFVCLCFWLFVCLLFLAISSLPTQQLQILTMRPAPLDPPPPTRRAGGGRTQSKSSSPRASTDYGYGSSEDSWSRRGSGADKTGAATARRHASRAARDYLSARSKFATATDTTGTGTGTGDDGASAAKGPGTSPGSGPGDARCRAFPSLTSSKWRELFSLKTSLAVASYTRPTGWRVLRDAQLRWMREMDTVQKALRFLWYTELCVELVGEVALFFFFLFFLWLFVCFFLCWLVSSLLC
jgi:hypothetical protein